MKHILSILLFSFSLSSFHTRAEKQAEKSLKLGRNELYASMSQLDYKTGKVTAMPEIKKKKLMKAFKIPKIHNLNELDGKNIAVDGFGIPLRMEEFVSEFMMVGDAMYCSHVEPPPPNQVIHVKMKKGKKGLPINTFGDITPFKIEGQLKVIRKKSDFGAAGFELIAEKVEKI